MCDPATAALAFSTGLKAFGAISAGKGEKARRDENARRLDRQRQVEIDRGEAEERRVRRRNRQALARGSLAAAASGVGILSTEQVMADDVEQLELDALTVRWATQVNAGDLSDQARIERMAGRQASQAGTFGAITALIGGAQTYGDRQGWFDPKETPVPEGTLDSTAHRTSIYT